MALLISSGGRVGSFLQLLGIIVIFVIVLIATYYTTRFVAGYQKVQTSNRNLKVLETLKLSQNTYVQIVQAGHQYLVVAHGKEGITLLTTLTEEEVEEMNQPPTPAAKSAFHDVFSNAVQSFKDHLPKRRS